MPSRFVRPFLMMAVASSLVLLGSGCTKSHTEEAPQRLTVTHPWKDHVETNRQYVAQIRGVQHIDLRAFEKGYLNEIFVDEGQLVKKGQKMFQIMPILVNAEYEKAKAELEASKIEYENTKRLTALKVVSRNELALTKAKYDKIEAELHLAKAHLDMTTITAPFDGIMGRFQVRLGSLVEEGEPLTTISDISNLWVYFNVSESDYLTYVESKKDRSPASVKLKLANGHLYNQPGKIDTIEADFNNETGNIPFRASFPNPEMVLRHGETGNILLSNTDDDALMIPQNATFEVLDKRYVYVVTPEGVLSTREISVASEVPHLFVVQSGLAETDTILLSGLGRVNNGDKITPVMVDGKEDVIKSLALRAE